MSLDIKVKNQKYGLCAICEKKARLSKDHIPPKCCGNKGKFIFTRLVNEKNFRENFIAQNGITFSFICDDCNNKMGALYDEEMAKFQNLIFDLGKDGNSKIKVDLYKILKCIIGHFLASYECGNSNLQNAMKKFYLDNQNIEKEFLDKYSLYCYLYSFEDKIFVLNEYTIKNIIHDSNEDGSYSSLYFYPFAFLITEKDKFGTYANLTHSLINKAPFMVSGKDWYKDGKLKSYIWPADVTDEKIILLGDSVKSSVIVIDNK